ncbi:MAG: hypothetical protein IPH35_17130 [Rhodoferax sp.]|nr:hypothetical protein [Rhodoferax sp.]
MLLLAGLIFLLWRGWRVFAALKAPTALTNTPTAMLACRFCGVHIPKSEAIHSKEGIYCCQPHRITMEKVSRENRE